MKATFYYPETGEMVMDIEKTPVVEFFSLDEARLFLDHISSEWSEIQTQSKFDLAAFLNKRTGHLVVLREMP